MSDETTGPERDDEQADTAESVDRASEPEAAAEHSTVSESGEPESTGESEEASTDDVAVEGDSPEPASSDVEPQPEETPPEPGSTGELRAIEASLDEEHPADQTPEAVAAVETPAEQAGAAAVAGDATATAATPSEAVASVDVPQRRSGAWVWVGLVVGVLIAGGLVAYAWWYTTSRPIQTPNVVGKLPAQATQTLNDVGLRLGQVSEAPTETAPVGTIIEQNPAPSTVLKPDDAVSFVVAAAPEGAKVPDVVGLDIDEAEKNLATARLRPYRVEGYNPDVGVDVVASQVPSAGVELQPGSVVALAVSKGPAPAQIRVPNLVGMKEEDAKQLLDADGIDGAVYRSYNASITAGTVYAQQPSAESLITYDTVVQYLVSQGAGVAAVTVPDLVGDKREDAEKQLKELGLKPKVKSMPSSTVAKGLVIRQLPAAGSKTARGAGVGLLVSKGPATKGAVPMLVGLTSDEAEKTTKSAGFTPLAIEVSTADHTVGEVYAQYPDAEVQWPLRLPVIAFVAKQ